MGCADLEAEVRYAVRYEYAQKATDVLARRTRLAFLNVQAAVDALPRVIDIMADELDWSRSRKAEELRDSMKFFESMGLSPVTIVPTPPAQTYAKQIWEKVENALWGGVSGSQKALYARARFEPGEVGTLRAAFEKYASDEKISTTDVINVLKEVPGYEDVSRNDYDYVLEEAGFQSRESVDFDEFVEICGNLKEVSFKLLPAMEHRKLSTRIPVEKSGGGV